MNVTIYDLNLYLFFTIKKMLKNLLSSCSEGTRLLGLLLNLLHGLLSFAVYTDFALLIHTKSEVFMLLMAWLTLCISYLVKFLASMALKCFTMCASRNHIIELFKVELRTYPIWAQNLVFPFSQLQNKIGGGKGRSPLEIRTYLCWLSTQPNSSANGLHTWCT